MNLLFKKRKPAEPTGVPQSTGASAGLPQPGDIIPDSLKAYSQFIKRVSCSQCGAPKSLPSKTAYIYCDYCGALMDYDFRIANADTNAGLTNTVFHRLIAPVQEALAQTQMRRDKDTYRHLYHQVFSRWIQECPMAVSPRAKTDVAFREKVIAYEVECAVTKDFDPRQAPFEAQMAASLASLQRIPMQGSAWRVAGDFWSYAGTFKKQMEMTYALIHELGVDALNPDKAPAGVPLQMEYSTFCQAWLPHLSPEDGERLLKFYGLAGEYDEFQPLPTDLHKCGACGAEMHTLPGARNVVCESCGHTIDIGGGDVPCLNCGAKLSFPVSTSHVLCPYCNTDTRRI